MPKEYYDDVCVSLVSVSLVFIIIIMVWQHDDAGERVTKMVLYSLLQQIFFFCAFCSTNQPWTFLELDSWFRVFWAG